MYGKLFQSTFTGSMFGSGPVVFAVWGYAIANVQKSRVELNPAMLASILGTDAGSIEAAIAYLCAPDPRSRTKDHEGKRLIREGEFQYFMPTHEKYRAIRNDDDRREYFRQKKAEQRARDAAQEGVSKRVSKTIKDNQTCPPNHNGSGSGSEIASEGESEGVQKQALAIYEAYPRHERKPHALKAIIKALLKLPFEKLLAKTQAYAEHCRQTRKEQTFIPYPATWFNGEGFNDALPVAPSAPATASPPILDPNDWRNCL